MLANDRTKSCPPASSKARDAERPEPPSDECSGPNFLRSGGRPMSVAPTPLPSRASRPRRADRPAGRPVYRVRDAIHPLELAAIAGLIRDNDRLIEILSAIAARIAEARSYLDTPGEQHPPGDGLSRPSQGQTFARPGAPPIEQDRGRQGPRRRGRSRF